MSSKSNKTKTTKAATCLCGAVSISATGTDKGAVACHCSNVRIIDGTIDDPCLAAVMITDPDTLPL